ncbi:unnamed protein product [Blepharisma stoltei]|uniref:Uncharacterized protein n=1 Tax=Blepharisma stoltei TaxID=1481888 RepID=A0AAU9IW24_9CILI|nr:unnamed protein product [Blepharisma stoltei]
MEKILKNGWKKYMFFICKKRVKKVLIKFFNSANFGWKKYKGEKIRGKKYIDFLENFLGRQKYCKALQKTARPVKKWQSQAKKCKTCKNFCKFCKNINKSKSNFKKKSKAMQKFKKKLKISQSRQNFCRVAKKLQKLAKITIRKFNSKI